MSDIEAALSVLRGSIKNLYYIKPIREFDYGMAVQAIDILEKRTRDLVDLDSIEGVDNEVGV